MGRPSVSPQEDVKHLKAQQKKLKATAEKEKAKMTEALALAEEKEASIPGLEAKAAKSRTALEKEEAKLATLMEGLKGASPHPIILAILHGYSPSHRRLG